MKKCWVTALVRGTVNDFHREGGIANLTLSQHFLQMKKKKYAFILSNQATEKLNRTIGK